MTPLLKAPTSDTLAHAGYNTPPLTSCSAPLVQFLELVSITPGWYELQHPRCARHETRKVAEAGENMYICLKHSDLQLYS